MTTPPPSEGPSPEEQARKLIKEWDDSHRWDDVEELVERIAALIVEAKRSAHLEDAETAMEEGRRMLAARGRAAQRHRDNVVSHRESDAETCGRIADLIRAKAEVWDALSLPPGGQK